MARSQPYLAIARELRELIQPDGPRRPRYQPGDKLPSVNDLRQGVEGVPSAKGRNHITIGNAIEELQSAGLVVTVPTVGTFVRRYPRLRYLMASTHDPRRLPNLPIVSDGWLTDVAAAGYVGRQDIQVKTVLGSELIDVYTVAELLGIATDEIALMRTRARFIAVEPETKGGELRFEPESLADSYYSHALVKDTPLMDPQGVNTAKILTELGHPQIHFLHEMISRVPTAEESRRLQLQRGSTVMERITIARDPGNRPVYVQHVVTAGNGSRFVFEVNYRDGGE